MLYPVNEIFHSIQGEGRNTGMPAWFIRLAGCNLRCGWCDTDFSINNKFEPKNILNYLKENTCKNVVLTGGEPTVHDLKPLLRLLKKHNYYVAIETNGTNDLLQYRREGLLSWVTVSPKILPIRVNCIIDEIKVVWPSELDVNEIEKIKARYYCLQPLDIKGEPQIGVTLKKVFESSDFDWRLSLQTHKMIGLK